MAEFSEADSLLRTEGSRHRLRHAATVAGAVSVMALLAIFLVSSSVDSGSHVMLEESEEVNQRFLSAQAAGDDGHEFLQRLQDIWFVEQNAGKPTLATSASRVAGSIEDSSFPADMKAAVDVSVNPCEDFYEFACGKWIEENKDTIPHFKSRKAFAWDTAGKHVRETEIAALKEDQGPAGKFFRSCMDEEKVEKEGAKPLAPWLKTIDSITDQDSLLDAVVTFNKHDQDTLFTWYVERDPHDSTKYAFFIDQGAPSLPDRAYYIEDSETMKGHRAKLVERMTKVFEMVGRKNAADEAASVMKLETAIAKAQVDRAESRQDHGHATSWSKIEELAPSWPWAKWLKKLADCSSPPDGADSMCTEAHSDVTSVGGDNGVLLYIRNKAYFPEMEKLLKEHPLEAIKAEMRWQFLRNAAIYLDSQFIDEMVKLNADLYGISEKNPRPRKCFYSTTGEVGWAAAKLYVEKGFTVANRKAALTMLEAIRGRFMEALKTEPWMSEEDRKAAQHKLHEMFFQVGWPTDAEDKDAWPEATHAFDGLMGDDYFTNYMVVNRYSIQKELKKILKKPDRRHWGGSTPLQVNAFYGPDNNGLWIPAGILQAPFFEATFSDARNFGAIGSVLGHEMSHGFDDNGRQYDAKGELHDWWDKETVTGFKKHSTCISNLFDTYSIANRHVNGKLTLGEDIADSGGLKFSYQAFLESGESGDRTPEEKRTFFTAFTQTWCQVVRKKSALNSILTDTHAPAKFRVLGALSQFAPFAEAYQCPAGAPMSPLKRCRLW